MRTLVDHLSQYAAYHQDGRNVATHFIGIPMIVVAVACLLARPVFWFGEIPISPASVLVVLTALFYLRLDLRFGLAMAGVLALALLIGQAAALQSTTFWLGFGISLFVVGWVIQFIGHVFEGRKPAFVDDLMGLIIGPLFLLAEAAFALGLRQEVAREIERRLAANPVRAGGGMAVG